MDRLTPPIRLSPLREQLDSFENAYAIASRLYRHGVRPLFVVRSTEPLQPIRVTGAPRPAEDIILTMFA